MDALHSVDCSDWAVSSVPVLQPSLHTAGRRDNLAPFLARMLLAAFWSLKSAAEQLERYSKVTAKRKEVVAKDFWTYEDETVTRGELSFNRLTWTCDKCGSEDATYLRPVYPEQALARYKHAFKCNNSGEEYVK
jgi:hypothetical protein